VIHYLTARGNAYTVQKPFEVWQPDALDLCQFVAYEDLPRVRFATPGVYVFSDLERLTPVKLRLAAAFSKRLLAAGPGFKVLNDPSRVLSRFALLERLHETGQNAFCIARYRPGLTMPRYPVFLRWENSHQGSATDLLDGPDQLHKAAEPLYRSRNGRKGHLLVVEHCDTRDNDGIYRKYGVMKIGDELIPRHIYFSRNWMQKKSDIVTEVEIAEERAFIEDFPHREELAKIYQLAGIEYGRIDYGILNGRLQVWEINTNPNLAAHPDSIPSLRLELQEETIGLLVAAFVKLEQSVTSGKPIRPFDISDRPLAWAYRFRDLLRR
jgi:hypothetical protein